MSSITFVTTPIGNDKDITLNALECIQTSSVLVCEDTRVTKDLLKRLGLDYSQKQFISFNEHSEEHNIEGIILLATQKDVAFVSDAGSPLISDPAYPLLKMLALKGINYKCLGGVSALNLALEYSAMPITPFHFHGFCSREKSKLNKFIELIKTQYGTHVFFEGVSRVRATVEYLCKDLGDYDFVIARELTKTFESIHRFKGNDFSTICDDITYKGEFVVLIHNPSQSQASNSELMALAQEIIDNGAKPKKLAKLLSLITEQNTKEIYDKMRD